MNINVAQIREDEGLTIHHVYPEGEPVLGERERSRLVGKSTLDAMATREGDRVELEGVLNAEVEFNCDRCLSSTRVPVKQKFDLVYVPPLGTSDETELVEEDLEVGFYRGQVIDLDDVVREQIELALPMHRLCREECKGLCPECGANLNDARCDCKREPADPRWAALKQFKLDS